VEWLVGHRSTRERVERTLKVCDSLGVLRRHRGDHGDGEFLRSPRAHALAETAASCNAHHRAGVHCATQRRAALAKLSLVHVLLLGLGSVVRIRYQSAAVDVQDSCCEHGKGRATASITAIEFCHCNSRELHHAFREHLRPNRTVSPRNEWAHSYDPTHE
jgi:hypothetical protein